MSTGIVGRATAMTLIGIHAHVVLIETVILPGLPHCSIIGLPDAAVSEARERLRASFSHVGLPWPRERITINLSPSALPKTGTGLDVGLAIAILSAQGYKPLQEKVLALGELGLDGTIRPIRGVLPSVVAAQEHGFTTVIVPEENAGEAQLVKGINVVPVAHLAQIAQWMGSGVEPVCLSSSHTQQQAHIGGKKIGDMADIYGQPDALFGAEVAAGGGHHILMIGSPGVGKSMIAQRMPDILPNLTDEQAIEVAIIRSIQGISSPYLDYRPPIAAPHHSASIASLIGGGSSIARPGAITSAHNGLLYCDEFSEFSPRAIQALREPLETGQIDIARSAAVVHFPARFQLVAATNPCPCGKRLDGPGACSCTSRDLRTYQTRLGGPVRDRIDVVIHLNRPTRADIQHGPTTTTKQMRERVHQARQRQYARQEILNSQLSGTWLRAHTPLSSTMSKLFDTRLRSGQLSMRGMDRIMRLAWTICDLAQRPHPTDDDLALAFSLRTALEE